MPFKVEVSNIKAISPTTHIVHSNIINIGRDSQNDLVVAETNVSRQHAVISISEGAYLLTDCGSTHGTFIYKDDHWDRVQSSAKTSMPVTLMLGENILIRIKHFLVTLLTHRNPVMFSS